MTTSNIRNIKIYGMMRSGNHAIIEWIASHYNHTIHYNDCYYNNKELKISSTHHYGNLNKDIDLTIHSFEDQLLNENKITNNNVFIILRDWYNMASSRIISGRMMMRDNSFTPINLWLKLVDLYQKYPEKFIIYNFWVDDESYRTNIEKTFNLNGSGLFVKSLPKSGMGLGSSFGDKIICPNNVNKRYLNILNNHPKLFNEIENETAKNLCNRFFHMKIYN